MHLLRDCLFFLPLSSLAVAVRSNQKKSVPAFLSPEARSKAHYYKQSGVGQDSLYTAPFDLSGGPSWSWHHPKGRGHTTPFGITIDGDTNLYLTAIDGVRKFTPSGQLLWEHIRLPAKMYNTASLDAGKVIGQDLLGHVFALNMSTGKTIWETKVSDAMGQNNGYTNVDDGIVVVDSHATMYVSRAVSGINATDGSVLWTIVPETSVFNFAASFPGDGSVTFQDYSGVAYRLRAKDGKLLWKSPKHYTPSWTDGTATIDSDRNVYTVENTLPSMEPPHANFFENSPGVLTKRRLSDGQVMWQVITPHPPNNLPAVGHGLVVVPQGAQAFQNASTYVYAYDQKTGDIRWVFQGPAQKGEHQAGDGELEAARLEEGLPGFCWPNPWSAPGFGQDGTVYIGNQEGGFYSLRDANGDGVVSGPAEVSVYQTSAAFAGSSSPAIAPGLLATTNCDTMYVFRY